MQEHKIVVTRTAHYYTQGEPGDHIKYFWFCCHGYGQAASNFIQKFDSIKRDDTFVLAPEGLSRFYWAGFTGDVVSSWMTKKDRLDEIQDYTNYLNKVFYFYLQQLPEDVTIILMGFSQGVATQFRWIMHEFPVFDFLIMWAGLIPEDLNYLPHRAYFAEKSMHLIYGDKDQFLTTSRMEKHQELVNRFQFDIHHHTFKGKHRVIRTHLIEIDQMIRNSNAEESLL